MELHMGVKQIVKIDCPVLRGKSDDVCEKCALPLRHHQVKFEVLEYDDLYDV